MNLSESPVGDKAIGNNGKEALTLHRMLCILQKKIDSCNSNISPLIEAGFWSTVNDLKTKIVAYESLMEELKRGFGK